MRSGESYNLFHRGWLLAFEETQSEEEGNYKESVFDDSIKIQGQEQFEI